MGDPRGDRLAGLVGQLELHGLLGLVLQDDGAVRDGAAGKEEIVNRRVGRNELYTIEVMRDLVEAQGKNAPGGPGAT